MTALITDTKQFELVSCPLCEGDEVKTSDWLACLGAGELQQLILVKIDENMELRVMEHEVY